MKNKYLVEFSSVKTIVCDTVDDMIRVIEEHKDEPVDIYIAYLVTELSPKEAMRLVKLYKKAKELTEFHRLPRYVLEDTLKEILELVGLFTKKDC